MMELNRALTYLPILFALYINDLETFFLQENGIVGLQCVTVWKLNVNVEKTKILKFSKGPITKRHFYYNEIIIEKSW